MKQFPLRFLAADRVFYEGPCESLMVPLTDGLYGVQADHTDMMGAIIAGEAILRIPSGEKFNGDTLVQVIVGDEERTFSTNLACPDHGVSIEELEPRMFSFNNPMGACPECNGLGFVQQVDPDLLIPDQSLK